MATYNLSSAAMDAQRQLWVVAKQQQMANQQTALATTLTALAANANALLTLCNAAPSGNVDLTVGQASTTTG